jgi:hypothetical protein
MSTVQNQNYTAFGAYVDFATGTCTVTVSFTDADDGSPAGTNTYQCPTSGPIQDARGRVVAAGTPGAVTTAGTNLKTAVLAALATGSAAGKVKP